LAEVLILHPELVLTQPSQASLRANEAVVVEAGNVVAIGPIEVMRLRWPSATQINLPGCLLMPGLVNAHQHGRGLSQVQIGYHDLPLETWISQRRGRGILSPYALAKLTAANMLANGVTTAIQANFAFGSGNYEQELRDQWLGYNDAGIRMTMCVGAMDRGGLVYPPQEACFMRGLPADMQDWLKHASGAGYVGDGAATLALMARLLSDFGGHDRIRWCYGPAGPQWVSDELFAAIGRDARDKGLGIHMHALESPVQRKVMEDLYPGGVFAHLEQLGVINERSVIAHCVWANDADGEVLARTGATVVRNPGCNLRLSNGIAPMARYLRQGVRVAIGTDNHSLADDEDLLAELRLASCLAREPDWTGPAPPTVDELLAIATVNGAVAAQFGGEIGEIKPGMKADLVAFSLDMTRSPILDPDMPLLEAFMARAGGRDTRMTMVNGRILYRDGQFTDIDFAALTKEAVAVANGARRPADPKNRQQYKAMRPRLEDHYARILRSHAGCEHQERA
jgi:cytosine/adenosine deaminase-related metal-dependent hydrolase